MPDSELPGDDRSFQVDATLVANFTHQIINPLNGVVGTLDNLIDGTTTGQRREQRLRAVRAQLTYTIEMVRNLAYLSQLSTEAGRQGLRNFGSSCLVPELVIESAMFFQELGRERHIQIELDDRDTQYVVKGHEDLLRQVFTNLLENAVKYGFEGSTVHITPWAQKGSHQLIVEVRNLGPGFAYDDRERLFERGYRGASAKALVASGSGLGLYICREILDAAFGATIEAEHSAKKEETTFRIRFPHFVIDEEIRRLRRAASKEL